MFYAFVYVPGFVPSKYILRFCCQKKVFCKVLKKICKGTFGNLSILAEGKITVKRKIYSYIYENISMWLLRSSDVSDKLLTNQESHLT